MVGIWGRLLEANQSLILIPSAAGRRIAVCQLAGPARRRRVCTDDSKLRHAGEALALHQPGGRQHQPVDPGQRREGGQCTQPQQGGACLRPSPLSRAPPCKSDVSRTHTSHGTRALSYLTLKENRTLLRGGVEHCSTSAASALAGFCPLY